MSLFNSMEISSSGLYAQKTRLNTIASNLANIQTTRTPQGGPYVRKTTIFAALPKTQNFQEALTQQASALNQTSHVKVVGIAEDKRAFNLKYEPNHPDANEEGYVAYPNVNLTEEMVDMIEAKRSFEANVAAFNVAKSLAIKSLEIGRV